MESKNSATNFKDKLFEFAKKATVKTQKFVQQKVDNHNINNAKSKLKFAQECLVNLEPEDLPELPKESDINSSTAREIIDILTKNQKILSAVNKGRTLNENIKESTSLLNDNAELLALLPDKYQPKMPVLSQVTQEKITEIQNAINLANACKLVEEACERLNNQKPVEVPLAGFYKAYGIDAYRFAADQIESPNLVLGATAVAATRGIVSGGIAAASIIGTGISSYHKAVMDGVINNMKMYLPDITNRDRRTLATLFALNSLNLVPEKQFFAAYYGFAFNEGETYLSYEKYEESINNNKEPGKAEKISLGCAAYLLESSDLYTRAECENICRSNEERIAEPVLEIIRNKMPYENK